MQTSQEELTNTAVQILTNRHYWITGNEKAILYEGFKLNKYRTMCACIAATSPLARYHVVVLHCDRHMNSEDDYRPETLYRLIAPVTNTLLIIKSMKSEILKLLKRGSCHHIYPQGSTYFEVYKNRKINPGKI